MDKRFFTLPREWSTAKKLLWLKLTGGGGGGGGSAIVGQAIVGQAIITGGEIESAEPFIINMADFFWANGSTVLSSLVTGDETAETYYLLVNGQKGDATVTVDGTSPLAQSDLGSGPRRGIIEYPNGKVDMVSLYVEDGAVNVYPPLKENASGARIYSCAYGIHLTRAAYKYYADCIYGADRKYSRKSKAIAQFNPYASTSSNPLTKIGTFWWGKGTENVYSTTYKSVEHCTTDYLNCNFSTGATAQSPKGFKWSVTLGGKSGYFEMYVGGRDKNSSAEFAAGLEFNIEFYLDGVLANSLVKKTKKCEPIRFDFDGAQTGEVRLYVTSEDGTSKYSAFLEQATWWETDEPHGKIFKSGLTPLLYMDSWGVYKDNEVQKELAALHGSPIVNKSSGSKASAWGLENFSSLVASEHPDYMISDFQINDISTGVTQADFITNMTGLMSAAVTAKIAPVMVMQMHFTSTGAYFTYSLPFVTAITQVGG